MCVSLVFATKFTDDRKLLLRMLRDSVENFSFCLDFNITRHTAIGQKKHGKNLIYC